jgi:hypothetical protein
VALDELHATRSELPKDLVVVLISADDKPETVVEFVKQKGWAFDVVACSGKAMKDPAFAAFAVASMPHQVLIGADGKVIAQGHHLDINALLK